MNEPREKVQVTMKFSKSTIEKVESLVELTGITNKTQIIAQAIHIYNFIEKARRYGDGRVYIEYADGTRERLVIAR